MLADYHIVYSRRRTLAIVIRHGQVTVRAPVGCKIKLIQQLMQDKQPWIKRHLLHQQTQPPRLSWQQRGELLFKGKLLKVVFCRATKSNVSVIAEQLVIAVNNRVSSANLMAWHDKLLNQWLQAQATKVFQQRLSSWAEAMDINFSHLTLGQWQRRWGYCDSYGNVGLNWKLIMAPEWVYDYVMVHELAHRQNMNHSPCFWRTVSRFVPHYAQAQAWLNYNQQQLVE